MGMNKKIREKVYSSGEAALSYLKKNYLDKKYFIILDPTRDFDLFIDFKKNKTENIKIVLILCYALVCLMNMKKI